MQESLGKKTLEQIRYDRIIWNIILKGKDTAPSVDPISVKAPMSDLPPPTINPEEQNRVENFSRLLTSVNQTFSLGPSYIDSCTALRLDPDEARMLDARTERQRVRVSRNPREGPTSAPMAGRRYCLGRADAQIPYRSQSFW